MAGVSASTYTFIAKQSVSGTTSVTFSNIPQNYTDLVMVVNAQCATNDNSAGLQFNGDTGTNYSFTFINGDGSSATSAKYATQSAMQVGLMNNANWSTSTYHIQNYSSQNMYKTVIGRGSMSDLLRIYASNWYSLNPITSITVISTPNSYNFLSGSTITLYGIKAADVGVIVPAKAFGGDSITTDATYTYHTFKTSGTFVPNQALTADILVIAGGGGGGSSYAAGGGGAGGYVLNTSVSLAANTTYTCTVGAGGLGDPNNNFNTSSNGGNSNVTGGALSLTAAVGGGAGGGQITNPAGQSGGSGGGGMYFNGTNNGAGQPGGSGTAGQGNAGATGLASSGNHAGGGGGGAGGAAASVSTGAGGAGGVGVTSATINAFGSASGTGHQTAAGTFYYCGGGGGGGYSSSGAGGNGGGGRGAGSTNILSLPGTPWTGGGGGGSESNVGTNSSSNGGSGVVIVRYAS